MADFQLEQIEEKLQQLLKKYSHLQKEMEKLQKENADLHKQLEVHKTNANQLQAKIDIVKVDTEGMTTEDKKSLEKRIDGYLKEIEKCMALLHE